MLGDAKNQWIINFFFKIFTFEVFVLLIIDPHDALKNLTNCFIVKWKIKIVDMIISVSSKFFLKWCNYFLTKYS